jgi:hypothetical protein
MYNRPAIAVGWNTTFDSSNAIFTSLSNGEFDSACARFSPDGTWKDPGGIKRPRSLAFSNMLCATYLERSFIYVLPATAAAGITSMEALAAAVSKGNITNVCTPTQPTSGTVTSCSLQINRYLSSPPPIEFECIGKSDTAFTDLDAGICDAVWGAADTDTSTYGRFTQPTVTAWSSFFRNENLPPPEQVQPVLTTGAIVGILFGFLAFVVLLFTGVYFIKTKQNERRLKSRFVRQVARNISIASSPNQLSADDIAKEIQHISGGKEGGAVTKSALKTWLDDGKLGLLSDKDFELLWSSLDTDNSGTIDPVEFCTYLSGCGEAFDEVNEEHKAMSKEEKIMFASRRLSVIKGHPPVVEDEP